MGFGIYQGSLHSASTRFLLLLSQFFFFLSLLPPPKDPIVAGPPAPGVVVSAQATFAVVVARAVVPAAPVAAPVAAAEFAVVVVAAEFEINNKKSELKTACDFLDYIFKSHLVDTYPNLYFALCKLLITPVTFACPKRSVSKQKLIKKSCMIYNGR